MSIGIITTTISLVITAYVLWRGNFEMRLAILIVLANEMATLMAFAVGSHRWLPLNVTVFAIDMLAFVGYYWLVNRCNNYWPILLAGWQLAGMVIHLASAFVIDLAPNAYGIGQGIWAYLQYAMLLVVVIRRQPLHAAQ
jgi:hypothetical protein